MRGISRPAEDLSASQEGALLYGLICSCDQIQNCVNEH